MLLVEEAIGETPVELLDLPEPPPDFAWLLDILWLLSKSTGDQQISYRDLEAFQRMDGTPLNTWDCEALIRLSAAIQSEMAEQRRVKRDG